MINTAKHVIGNTIPTHQIPLKDCLVSMLVDLLEEEPLVVAVIFLSAYTSFENAWYGQIFDKVVLDDHGASLVLAISFLVLTDCLRLGAQSPKSQRVVNDMVVQVHLKSVISDEHAAVNTKINGQCLRLCHPPWW